MKTIFIAFTLKNSSVADFCVTLANYLDRDYQVVIFSHANEEHDFQLSKSIKVLRWPSKRPTGLRDLIFLIRQIRKYRPQTIIANFAAVNIFMLGGFISGVKNRVAWYHTLTSQLDYNKFLQIRKGAFYKMASKIITNSEAAKMDISLSFKVPPKKVEVVNNAVRDPGIRSSARGNTIVFAGRLHQVKGIEVLVRALALVREKFENIQLVVIGEDEGTGVLQKLKSLQKELGLNQNIQFVGNRSRGYVLEHFSTAYCTVVPSFFEAFGYVVIESFSVHTPVIGSNTTGISEIVRDNKDGLLFEPGNSRELGEKIIQLLENRICRDRMADNCYNRFLRNYELKNVVKQFAENNSIFS